MDRFRMQSREVEASRITAIRPLVIHGEYLPKSAGVCIVLDDHSTLNWQADGANEPTIGSWVIRDLGFGTHFIVDDNQFNYGFRPAAGCF